MWKDKYLAELKRTIMLQNVCVDLREEFQAYNTMRASTISKKLLPKFADAREIPSKKVILQD